MKLKIGLLASFAVIAMPSPASARDATPYVGLEAGIIKPEKLKFDYRIGALEYNNGLAFKHRSGVDVDYVAGYDFGFIRAEGELGYKRAKITDVAVAPGIFALTGRPTANGRSTVLSAMGNLLLDVGPDNGLQLYGGAGAGVARIKTRADITGPGVPVGAGIPSRSDRSFAWQLLAGMRVPVNSSVDLGLKYRYFRTKAKFGDPSVGESLNGRFKSHSILASFLYNFGAPAPVAPPPPLPAVAPPPPPPPPATQTCPDGTVILASDVCPVPPPPPPPPAPERG